MRVICAVTARRTLAVIHPDHADNFRESTERPTRSSLICRESDGHGPDFAEQHGQQLLFVAALEFDRPVVTGIPADICCDGHVDSALSRRPSVDQIAIQDGIAATASALSAQRIAHRPHPPHPMRKSCMSGPAECPIM